MQQFFLVFGLFWPVIMGYRLGDTHYTDYTNHHHRGHHIRHQHREESHNHHGPLDSILRRLEEHHKKDDVLSVEEAAKQLQKAMDAYRKSIEAVKPHLWDDVDEKKNDDDWSIGVDNAADTAVANADDKNRGVDDGFANYDSNGVEVDDRDDGDSERMDDTSFSEFAADAPHSGNLPSSESFSTVKWEALGTPERLLQTMNDPAKISKLRSNSAVQNVANTPSSVMLCGKPIPVTVKISKVYPHLVLQKEYYLDCVTLHMCSGLSGCCINRSEVCVPSETEVINLQLNVRTFSSPNHNTSRDKGKKIHREFLQFRTHKRCSCQEDNKNDLENDTIDWTMFAYTTSFPRHPLPSVRLPKNELSAAGQRQARNIVQKQPAVSSRMIQTQEAPPKTREERCRCPSRYTARLLANGECICDCFDKQADCLRNKRGKDYFGKPDADCVRRGECHLPSCDYGDYMKFIGRCPGRVERFQDSWRTSKNPSNYYSSRSWRSHGS